jgi:hypothetical protein
MSSLTEFIVNQQMDKTSVPAPEVEYMETTNEELDRRGSHPERAWCEVHNMWTGCDVLWGNVVVIRDNKQYRKWMVKPGRLITV